MMEGDGEGGSWVFGLLHLCTTIYVFFVDVFLPVFLCLQDSL